MHQCDAFKLLKTNPTFWYEKLASNTKRDAKNYAALNKQHWKVIVVWECAIKGKYKTPEEELVDLLQNSCRSKTKISKPVIQNNLFCTSRLGDNLNLRT